MRYLTLMGLALGLVVAVASALFPASAMAVTSDPRFFGAYCGDYRETVKRTGLFRRVKTYHADLTVTARLNHAAGGGVTGWGTHSLDQVQCALGTDDTGPVEIWLEEKDSSGWPPVMLRYANGTLLKLVGQRRTWKTSARSSGAKKVMSRSFAATPGQIRRSYSEMRRRTHPGGRKSRSRTLPTSSTAFVVAKNRRQMPKRAVEPQRFAI